jgi:hypothetical protein
MPAHLRLEFSHLQTNSLLGRAGKFFVRAGNLGGAQDAQSGLQTDRAVPKKTAPRPIKGSWQGFKTEHLG